MSRVCWILYFENKDALSAYFSSNVSAWAIIILITVILARAFNPNIESKHGICSLDSKYISSWICLRSYRLAIAGMKYSMLFSFQFTIYVDVICNAWPMILQWQVVKSYIHLQHDHSMKCVTYLCMKMMISTKEKKNPSRKCIPSGRLLLQFHLVCFFSEGESNYLWNLVVVILKMGYFFLKIIFFLFRTF